MAGPKSHNLGGIFDSMDFPPYVYREYPKMISVDGRDVIVQNQREEIAMLREIPTDQVATDLTAELDAKDKEIASLRAMLAASQSAPTVESLPSAIDLVKPKK